MELHITGHQYKFCAEKKMTMVKWQGCYINIKGGIDKLFQSRWVDVRQQKKKKKMPQEATFVSNANS